jgi:DNA-binding XRE family transcriptional regulator
VECCMAESHTFSGRRLRELRERAGVSRMHLAFAVGRTEQTVFAWEAGRARPLPELLDEIAHVLGVVRDDLFESEISNV